MNTFTFSGGRNRIPGDFDGLRREVGDGTRLQKIKSALRDGPFDILRRTAEQMQMAVADVAGVEDLRIEQQITIPQMRIEIDRQQLK